MQKHLVAPVVLVIAVLTAGTAALSENTPEGTARVSAYGYEGCIELSNASTRVVLEPNCGGRIIEYSRNGVNSLYVDPEQNGWTWTPGERAINPSGGRFDIGPEMIVPRRSNLWVGAWEAEITGPRSARLTSVRDESSGVQLVREFTLDRDSSHLRVTQTIINISDEMKRYNHWSRTLADGGGVCIVPLSDFSRFPLGYIYYGPGPVLNYRHEEHPNIRVRDGYLEILGTPPQPKFGIDSYAGWLGYITRRDLLFVKRFPVFPTRHYGEVAGYTISLWYFKESMCELEPIGPLEYIKPGESASFTEDWWLLPYKCPAKGENVDLASFETFVQENAR